jgi:hypothetical protein
VFGSSSVTLVRILTPCSDARVGTRRACCECHSTGGPLRSASGYRYFTFEMLQDIAACCYRHRWFTFGELKSAYLELAMAAHCDTGECEIPG